MILVRRCALGGGRLTDSEAEETEERDRVGAEAPA